MEEEQKHPDQTSTRKNFPQIIYCPYARGGTGKPSKGFSNVFDNFPTYNYITRVCFRPVRSGLEI